MGARCRLVPHTGVQIGALVGQPPGQRDDLGDRELDDAAGVGKRCVEDRNATIGGRAEINLVGPDAECPDGKQVGRRVKSGCADVGLRADAEQVYTRQPVRELSRIQRASNQLDAHSGGFEQSRAVGVDALEQQRAHAVGEGR